MPNNLDRFKPPQAAEEPRALCTNCGAEGQAPDMLYDERAEHYYCDTNCAYEWLANNTEKVEDYYYHANIR